MLFGKCGWSFSLKLLFWDYIHVCLLFILVKTGLTFVDRSTHSVRLACFIVARMNWIGNLNWCNKQIASKSDEWLCQLLARDRGTVNSRFLKSKMLFSRYDLVRKERGSSLFVPRFCCFEAVTVPKTITRPYIHAYKRTQEYKFVRVKKLIGSDLDQCSRRMVGNLVPIWTSDKREKIREGMMSWIERQ